MHPIQQIRPKNPLIHRFCPRLTSPISPPNSIRLLLCPVSGCSHTVLYTSGIGPHVPNLVVLDPAHSSWTNHDDRSQGVARQKRLSSDHRQLVIHVPMYRADHPFHTLDGVLPTWASIIDKIKALATTIAGADGAAAAAVQTPTGAAAKRPARAKRRRATTAETKGKQPAAGGGSRGGGKKANAPDRDTNDRFCGNHGLSGGQGKFCMKYSLKINQFALHTHAHNRTHAGPFRSARLPFPVTI